MGGCAVLQLLHGFGFVTGMITKLKENYEFRRAYKKGKALVCPYFVIYAVRRKGGVRMGITAGKKLGGAVQRNRAKRVLTAAFAECLPGLANGYDFVLVARTRILTVKSTVVAAAMKKLLATAGIYEYDKQNTDKAD